VIIAPGTRDAVSMIQIEAYKKWVLVGLLQHGTQLSMPKTTTPSSAKAYRAIAKPYDALAEKFKTGDRGKLAAEIDVGQNIWQQDRNFGLVLQVMEAFRRFSVLNLGKTFAALPIAKVAERTSPKPSDIAETEAYLASLIASGDLEASLTKTSGNATTLRFHTTLTPMEATIQQDIASQSNALMEMMKHLGDEDGRIELSKEYVMWIRRLKMNRDTQAKNGITDDFDEDMMADMQ